MQVALLHRLIPQILKGGGTQGGSYVPIQICSEPNSITLRSVISIYNHIKMVVLIVEYIITLYLIHNERLASILSINFLKFSLFMRSGDTNKILTDLSRML